MWVLLKWRKVASRREKEMSAMWAMNYLYDSTSMANPSIKL